VAEVVAELGRDWHTVNDDTVLRYVEALVHVRSMSSATPTPS
jgi:hypothetical protein